MSSRKRAESRNEYSFLVSTSREQVRNWEEVGYLNSIEGFQKLGFDDLYRKLSRLKNDQIAVINYEVNNPRNNYFRDESMLKYLSIASEKVRYIAFYDSGKFVGAIKIGTVISGLSSGGYPFMDFGEKNKEWRMGKFPRADQTREGFSDASLS